MADDPGQRQRRPHYHECDDPHGLTFARLQHMIHVGLPIACAGTIEVGNLIHIDRDVYVVTKVGGAAFDMVRRSEDSDA